MSRFERTPEGWLAAYPSPEAIAEAERKGKISEQRRTGFYSGKSAEGWLVERALRAWLDEIGIHYEVHGDWEDEIRDDLLIGGTGVAVKGRAVRGRMRLDYDVPYPARQWSGVSEWIFWGAVESSTRVVLLGAARPAWVEQKALLKQAGEKLGSGERVIEAMYELGARFLLSPEHWRWQIASAARNCPDCGEPFPAPDYPYVRCLRCELLQPVPSAG